MLHRFFTSICYETFFCRICCTALAVLVMSGCSCKDTRKTETKASDDNYVALVGSPNSEIYEVTSAVAYIRPVKGNKVKGKVSFKQVEEGIQIIADFDGLTPGKHGFHVHEYGNCGGTDASSAGAHFDIGHHKHGSPDSLERHVGDLGNVEADANGHAHYERVDKVIALSGRNSILGRSIIIHADEDDFHSQPAGASGAKIACGIIEVVP